MLDIISAVATILLRILLVILFANLCIMTPEYLSKIVDVLARIARALERGFW